MADKKMTFGIGIKTTYDPSGINKLKNDLTNLGRLGKNVQIAPGKDSVDNISKAVSAANTLKNALTQAYNPKLGTATFDRFNRAIQQSGTSLQQLRTNLHTFGTAGDKAFLSTTSSLMRMNTVARSTSTVLDKMFVTLKNTITWGMSSALWNGITGSIQKTYYYIKDLDTALNDIRIVTGKSNDEMAAFAKNANEAAKALGTSTRNYAEGSLIYYQQGLSDEEVKTRTDITAKTAMVTGQSMDQVSEQLTAVWNGYKVSAEEAELYIDRLAAVAATTASNLEELSTGMSKVASSAANLGVSESQLSAILATTISVTRQAPESVGTAYKTIFARISDIKAGLDTETTFGNYTSKMAEMGISVLDTTGNLRDMGEVIEEIGTKWQTMTREQQISLAQTMAGTRQYNNLVALFDNWSNYEETLKTAEGAAGTLAKQHNIALDSINSRLNILKATWEELYQNLISSDDIKNIVSALTNLVQVVTDLVIGLGGLKTILPVVGGLFLQLAAPKIGQELGSYINNFQRIREEALQAKQVEASMRQSLSTNVIGNPDESQALTQSLDRMVDRYSTLNQYSQYMTEEEKESVNALMEQEEALGRISIDLENNKRILEGTNVSAKELNETGYGFASRLGYGQLLQGDKTQQAQNLITQGSQLQSFGRDFTNKDIATIAFNQNSNIDEIDNFKNILADIAQQAGLTTEQIDKLKKEVNNLGLDFDSNSRLTEESAQAVMGLGQKAADAGQSLIRMGTDMQTLSTNTEIADESFKNMRQSLNVRATIDDITTLTGTFSSLSFSIVGVTNLVRTLNNDTMSASQKAITLISTASFLLSGLAGNLRGIQKVGAIFKEGFSGAKTLKNYNNEKQNLEKKQQELITDQILKKEAATTAQGELQLAIQKKYNAALDEEALKKEIIEKREIARQEEILAGHGFNTTNTFEKEDFANPHIVKAKVAEKEAREAELKLAKAQKLQEEVEEKKKAAEEAREAAEKAGEAVDKVNEEVGELNEKVPETPSGLAGLIASAPQVAIAAAVIVAAIGAIAGAITWINYEQEKETKKNLEKLKTLKEESDAREEQNQKLNETIESYRSLSTQLEKGEITQREYRNQVIALTKDIEDQSLKLKLLASDYQDLENILKNATLTENNSLIEDYSTQEELAAKTMVSAGKQGTKTSSDLLKLWSLGNANWIKTGPASAFVAAATMADSLLKSRGQGNTVISKTLDSKAEKEIEKALVKNLGSNVDVSGPGGIQLSNLDNQEKIVEIYEGINKTIQENAHLANTQTIKELTQIRDNMQEAYEIQKDAQDKRKELQKQNLFLDYDTSAIQDEKAYFDAITELAMQAMYQGLFDPDQLVEARTWANTMLSGISKEAADWSKSAALGDQFVEAFGLGGFAQVEADKIVQELSNEFSEAELKYLLPMAYTASELTGETTAEGIIEGFKNKLSDGQIQQAIEVLNKQLQKNKIEVALQLAMEGEGFQTEQIQDLLKDIDFKAANEYLNVSDDFNSMAFGNQALTSIWTANQMAPTEEEVEQMVKPWEEALTEASERVEIAKMNMVNDTLYNSDAINQDMLQQQEVLYYDDMGYAVYGDEVEDYTGRVKELIEAYRDAGGDTEKFTEAQKQLLNELVKAGVINEENFDHIQITSKAYESASAEVEILTEQIESAKASQQDWNKVIQQGQKINELYNARLDDIQSAYKTLSTAEKEWKLNEGFSVDTLQSLIKMSPKYLNALEMEGNQFKVNTEELNNVARAQGNVLVNEWEMERASEMLAAIEAGTNSEEMRKLMVTHSLSEEVQDLTSQLWNQVYAEIALMRETDATTAAMLEQMAVQDQAAAEKYRHVANNLDLTKDDKKSKSSKKDEKNYRDEFDRYWEFLKAIDKVAEAIEKLEKKEKNLYGKEKISSLKNKNELLNQQIQTYNDLYEEQKREQAELMESLGAQGMTFNAEGEITNYAKKTSEALAAYNEAVRSYNAGTLSEEAFKIQEKAYEEFKKQVDRYDKLYYSEMKDTIEKVEDIRRQILANNLEAWEIEIKLKIDWASLEREWSDFLHNIEKDFTAVYEDLGSELQNILEKANTYSSDDGTIKTDLQAIKDVMAEIDKLEAGGQSDMFESITQAQEKLKELNSSLMKDSTDLKKLWEEAYKAFLKGIDQLNDKLEDQMKRYEQIDKELAHQQKLIGLLYGDDAYEMMDKLYKNQEKNQLAEISSLKTQKDFWEEKWKAAEEGSQEQLKYYNLMIEAQNNLNSSVEAYIELLQKDLANAVQKTLDELGKSLTNGLGMDEARQQWDDLKKYNDGYFDENQRIFEIEKFGLTIEQKMANASAKTQKALKAFQEEELARLKEKEDLNEYDIKAAEYRLQLKEKELALEDAQNAKNSMKVTRDTNGNWTYQYVADEGDVADKQLDLLKTTEDYYNFAKERHDKVLEDAMDAYEHMTQMVTQIMADASLSQEEKTEKIREETEKYNKYVERLMKEAQVTAVDMAATAASGLKQSVDSGLVEMQNLSESQQAIVKEVIELNKADFESLYDAVVDNDNNIQNDIMNMLEETVPEWRTAAQDMADKWNADDGESVKNLVKEAVENIIGELEEYEVKLDELSETAGVDFNDIINSMDEATTATETLKDMIEELCNNNDLDSLVSQVNELEGAWDGVVGSIKDAIQQIEIYLRKQGQASNSKVNTNPAIGGNGSPQGGDYGNGPGSNPTVDPLGLNGKPEWWTVDTSGKIILGNGVSNVIATFPKDMDTSTRTELSKQYGDLPFKKTAESDAWYRDASIQGRVKDLSYADMQDLKKFLVKIRSFDTGGYTGSWFGGDGKLAMLHSKELVLNATDTSNFLSAISMIREIASFGTSIENSIASGLSSFASRFTDSAYGFSRNETNNSKQNIFNINAPITSTSTTDEIQNAILQLPNLASQYVSRNGF